VNEVDAEREDYADTSRETRNVCPKATSQVSSLVPTLRRGD